jgi:putative transcriptional regulator
MQLSNELSNHFLIKIPSKYKTQFSGSVVYITHHNLYSGAQGVIINKPISRTLVDMFKNVDMTQYGQKWGDGTLYFGGSVKPDNGFFLRKAATDQLDGFEITGNKYHLDDLVKSDGELFMSVGYSSWAPRQLETEIRNNNWLIIKGHNDLIFGMDPVIRYDEALKLAGVKNIGSLYCGGDIFA